MGASEMLSSHSIFRKFVGDVLEGVNAFLPERRSLQALFVYWTVWQAIRSHAMQTHCIPALLST